MTPLALITLWALRIVFLFAFIVSPRAIADFWYKLRMSTDGVQWSLALVGLAVSALLWGWSTHLVFTWIITHVTFIR